MARVEAVGRFRRPRTCGNAGLGQPGVALAGVFCAVETTRKVERCSAARGAIWPIALEIDWQEIPARAQRCHW
jgi:hypothetical protein